MPVKLSNDVIVSDSKILELLGKQSLTNELLSDHVNKQTAQLALGYDMKLTKLPDGSMKLEPEGKEKEVLEWVEKTQGSTFIKDKIQELINQRIVQKDWDELHELYADFKDLPNKDKEDIKKTIKEKKVK